MHAEASYAAQKIGLAPHNKSAWNYLSGVRKALPSQSLDDLCSALCRNVSAAGGASMPGACRDQPIVFYSHHSPYALSASMPAHCSFSADSHVSSCVIRLYVLWLCLMML